MVVLAGCRCVRVQHNLVLRDQCAARGPVPASAVDSRAAPELPAACPVQADDLFVVGVEDSSIPRRQGQRCHLVGIALPKLASALGIDCHHAAAVSIRHDIPHIRIGRAVGYSRAKHQDSVGEQNLVSPRRLVDLAQHIARGRVQHGHGGLVSKCDIQLVAGGDQTAGQRRRRVP